MNSEHYLLSLIENVQRRREDGGLCALTQTDREFALVWELEAEVNNGGFCQYFFNSGGGHALAARDALKAIGAHAAAQILQSALDQFGQSGPSSDRSLRQKQLEAFPDGGEVAFESMDVAFQQYPDNLSNLLAAHVRKNAT